MKITSVAGCPYEDHEGEIKIINPQVAGDYGVISNKARKWKCSGKTLKEAKGPGHFEIVVMNVPYAGFVEDSHDSVRRYMNAAKYKSIRIEQKVSMSLRRNWSYCDICV